MHRITLIIVGFILLLSACTQRLTCPAFQSAYIYDKEALRKKFSYFNEDSTPKILTASKNKYLIAVPESYRKKVRSLKTVEMTPIYPEIPDSLKVDEGAELMMAEREFVDSAAAEVSKGLDRTDSAYAITKTKEKFNVDQDNYMWYFRDALVMPDVRAALMQKEGIKEKQNESGGEKKPKRKGLFNRRTTDSTAVNGPTVPAVEDSTSSKSRKKSKPPKVKKEKKKKVKKEETPKEETPKKKEEEDDGFA